MKVSNKKTNGKALLKRMLGMKKSWMESSCDSKAVKKIESQGFAFFRFCASSI